MQQTPYSKRAIARTAGILYLLLFPLGIFGLIYFQMNVVVEGDIEATILNISNDENYFRFSIVSSLVLQIVFILLVSAFYKLFVDVDKDLAALMLIFVLVSVPITMSNELIRYAMLYLLERPETIHILVILHTTGVNITQIFWGLWLLPLGILIYKSGFIPKFLGVLMIIACFGYLIDSFLWFLYPNNLFSLSQYTFLGELLLPLFLLIKGINEQAIGDKSDN